MSKVGRAAFNSSRMRFEALGDADKTIASAETGEVYALTVDLTTNRTITLPAPQDGAYFKFLIMADLDGGNLIIQSAAAADYMIGGIAHQDSDGTTVNFLQSAAGDTADVMTIVGSNDGAQFGSWVELVSEGTYWYYTGVVHSDEIPTVA
jgi:hypothetical protein